MAFKLSIIVFILMVLISTLATFDLADAYMSGTSEALFSWNHPLLTVLIVLLSQLVALVIILVFNDDVRKNDLKEKNIAKVIEEETAHTTEAIQETIRIEALKKQDDLVKSLIESVATLQEKNAKCDVLLRQICKQLGFAQGLLYFSDDNASPKQYKICAKYAFIGEMAQIAVVEDGYGLNGQAAALGEPLYIKDVPKGYLKVVSGLGEALPDYFLVVPFKKDQTTVGFFELSGFGYLNKEEIKQIVSVIDQVMDKIYSA